ncbi:MAG: MGMT family protein [Geodermatophilaceae bacterium]|nr:MGMT family protein [Geodermatophilaceae bacterium]
MGVPSDFDELVYDVVERIPPGQVLSYGDIAELLGGYGPRRVAQALSRSGGAVPWHRVIRADGTPAPVVAMEQLARLRAEGTPLHGDRVDLRRARWAGSSSP